MNSDVFINDFEITENTESLHAILGRSIVIATRFDQLCDHLAKFLKLKTSFAAILPDNEFDTYISAMLDSFSTLNNNINSLPIEDKLKETLHDARKARNEVAHNLSIGMTGCLDTKIDEDYFRSNVSSLISLIAAGDFLISIILSILNTEPLPNYTENQYQKKIVNWTLGK